MIPQTTTRALLLMVADIKKAVKHIPLKDIEKDRLYFELHDILGRLYSLDHKRKTRRG